jgi:tRNA A37 threonylcarbamoyltransferase TsaD
MDEMAHEGKETMHFPRAMIKEDNYDFSAFFNIQEFIKFSRVKSASP